MGGHRFSADVRRDDESAALFHRAPLSAGSSPLPLLPGKAAKTPTTRRHVAAVRFICAPFTAVFRMKCARANTRDDDKLSNSMAAGMERGEPRRRPSLEELLRMDAASSRREDKTSPEDTVSGCRKEHAVVVFGVADSAHHISCTVEEEQMPLSPTKSRRAVVTGVERETAMVPVKVDVDLTMSPGGSTTLSPAVPVSASLRRALLQALRMDMGPSKGQYWKLARRSCAAGGKAELFYQRPIPMGRRCRVQHLEESPYM